MNNFKPADDLTNQVIHVWQQELDNSFNWVEQNYNVLAKDEQKRADRFKFDLHRNRFIIARGTLRFILSLYLDVKPADITFSYTENHKPILSDSPFQFNLSHSANLAVYAIRRDLPIGIDIEFMQTPFSTGVAKRYFSAAENEALRSLPSSEMDAACYCLWTRKEALLKAIGQGLKIPLSTFSVACQPEVEVVTFDEEDWVLIPLAINDQFSTHLATAPRPKSIKHFKYVNQYLGP